VFSIEFALISLAYLFGIYHIANIYGGIFAFLLVFGVIYPILLEFTIFDTALSILTTTLYSLLWAFSAVASLSIYSTLINIIIGIILVLLIWMLHDRLVPLKGVWGKKLLVDRILYKYFPFILLVFAILSVPFWTYILIITPTLSNFIVTLVYFAALLYLVFDTWDNVKKKYYVEKGEKHGKPKPKRRWRKASARPR
jgi:glycerol uptake facilitator-like aquaporin